jgi:hypothetical protein
MGYTPLLPKDSKRELPSGMLPQALRKHEKAVLFRNSYPVTDFSEAR